jgi:hypothetical protein
MKRHGFFLIFSPLLLCLSWYFQVPDIIIGSSLTTLKSTLQCGYPITCRFGIAVHPLMYADACAIIHSVWASGRNQRDPGLNFRILLPSGNFLYGQQKAAA